MINRQNWLDTERFCAYYEQIGRNPETVKRVRGIMRHLLGWAGETSFSKAREIDPSFQMYMITARTDGKVGNQSAASIKKACEYARGFFRWIHWEHPARYRAITESWIRTIQPGTGNGMQSEYHEHLFWEIEHVRKIAAAQVKTVTEERDQAAICFLFLSAMRAQAFVSMPVQAFNLTTYTVSQFPALGVATKNGKAAKTQLARIPELLEVVRKWDAKARAAGSKLWYPRIDRWQRFMGQEESGNWLSRTAILGEGIRHMCELAGVPYLSAHKLRHGHTVYMMRKVKDMKQLKALSQNLMHSSVAITDGIYGRLVSNDIQDMYEDLGE